MLAFCLKGARRPRRFLRKPRTRQSAAFHSFSINHRFGPRPGKIDPAKFSKACGLEENAASAETLTRQILPGAASFARVRPPPLTETALHVKAPADIVSAASPRTAQGEKT
jgi:hypothetical protein